MEIKRYEDMDLQAQMCIRDRDRVVRRKQNSLPPKNGRMPEKKEISSKAGI